MGLFNVCSPDSPLAIVAALVQLPGIAIFIRAILSWFVRDPYNPIVRVLDTITEPVLQPLRRIVPRMGMMDLTPLVAIIVLSVIGGMLCSA